MNDENTNEKMKSARNLVTGKGSCFEQIGILNNQYKWLKEIPAEFITNHALACTFVQHWCNTRVNDHGRQRMS